MTSFNRQVSVTTGSVSTESDSFPRFQPQGYSWLGDTTGWKFDLLLRWTRTAMGRVGDADANLEFQQKKGYSTTTTMHARCPSTHQGKKETGEVHGMIAEDQNIMHNYENLSGFTYTKVHEDIIDEGYHQCLPCNAGYS